MSMIQLRDVCKSFGANDVLRNLDLDVAEGETLVIVGRSGTGKSVTLKHIVGLLNPDSGDVHVNGRPVVGASIDELREIRRDVAYMFQTGALVNWMTVRTNIALPLVEARQLSAKEIDERVEEVLASVGLSEAADLLPAEISGGMRKRAALCRVLVLEPRAILYDEPTSGLDPIMSRTVGRLIRDVQTTHRCAAIVVTHDLPLAFRVATKIGLHDDGKLAEILPPDEFRRSDNPTIREFLADAPRRSEPLTQDSES